MSERVGRAQSAGPSRGILRHDAPDGWIRRERVLPCRALAPFVHHFWSIEWELRLPFRAEALSHPAAVLIVEESVEGPRAEAVGVCTGRVSKTLAGAGRRFGVTFRPASFEPLLEAPMSTLTDRVVPLERIFGQACAAWTGELVAAPHVHAQMALAEAFLAPRLRPLEPAVRRVRDIVERMMSDRSLLRVEDIARALELDVRALQRRFRRYVGVSPKWVIRRYRLHEALEALRGANPPTLAALAARLGYADQAHFARDFRLVVGRTPRAFGA